MSIIQADHIRHSYGSKNFVLKGVSIRLEAGSALAITMPPHVIALGADAAMLGTPLARASEAPGHGMHWGAEARHPQLPRGNRSTVGTVGSLREILYGPSHQADGTLNFIGALRRAMASTGYVDIKNFQRCSVVVTPDRR